MELILVRHALPVRRSSGDGTPADPPLSEPGRAQAEAVAAWLADERIDRLYASPLRRARETAAPLAARLGLEVELEPRVAEYDRHSDTYIPLEELRELDYEAWRDFMSRGYPEGMDLESFRHGVVTGCDEIIRANPGRCVVVVCHGGVINTWAAHVVGLGFKLFFNPGYTSINRFLASSEGVRSVGSLNEVPHLRGLSAGGSPPPGR
jgi:2,3-bisphosphoglycerate-dependent phosphoglycerate mutase